MAPCFCVRTSTEKKLVTNSLRRKSIIFFAYSLIHIFSKYIQMPKHSLYYNVQFVSVCLYVSLDGFCSNFCLFFLFFYAPNIYLFKKIFFMLPIFLFNIPIFLNYAFDKDNVKERMRQYFKIWNILTIIIICCSCDSGEVCDNFSEQDLRGVDELLLWCTKTKRPTRPIFEWLLNVSCWQWLGNARYMLLVNYKERPFQSSCKERRRGCVACPKCSSFFISI